MENKKSFVLYCDLIHTVEKLPDDKAGELFKHILKYVNDLEPKTDDILIDAVFEGIKQTLKRDLQKYLNIVERNKLNGSKGGRPKKPKKPSGLSGNPKKPKKADSDSDSDSVSDTDIFKVDNILKESETLNALKTQYKLSDREILNYHNEFKIPFLKDSYTPIEYKDRLTHFIRYIKAEEKKTKDSKSPEHTLSSKPLN